MTTETAMPGQQYDARAEAHKLLEEAFFRCLHPSHNKDCDQVTAALQRARDVGAAGAAEAERLRLINVDLVNTTNIYIVDNARLQRALDTARAEITRLSAELAHAVFSNQAYAINATRLSGEVAALGQALRSLTHFGDHLPTCGDDLEDKDDGCDCGYEAVRAEVNGLATTPVPPGAPVVGLDVAVAVPPSGAGPGNAFEIRNEGAAAPNDNSVAAVLERPLSDTKATGDRAAGESLTAQSLPPLSDSPTSGALWPASGCPNCGPGPCIDLDACPRGPVKGTQDVGEPCVGCGKRSRITTAGCDHCDYEDK